MTIYYVCGGVYHNGLHFVSEASLVDDIPSQYKPYIKLTYEDGIALFNKCKHFSHLYELFSIGDRYYIKLIKFGECDDSFCYPIMETKLSDDLTRKVLEVLSNVKQNE